MAYFKNLVNQAFVRTKKISDDKLNNLYLKPAKEKNAEMAHYDYNPDLKNLKQQIDTLYLPSDGAYKYALIVVDVYTRRMDARALKSHSATEVLSAIQDIWNGKYLKQPKFIRADSGSEFKADFKKEIEKLGIKMSIARVGRHRQCALAESKNRVLGTIIHRFQSAVEEETGYSFSGWVEWLAEFVKLINKHVSKHHPKVKDYPLYTEKMLKKGSKVRIILEYPQNKHTGERLHGKFRDTDMRWEDKIRTVNEILIKDGSAPMYKISGIDDTLYTIGQLQKVPNNEAVVKIDKHVMDKIDNTDKYQVDKILGRKIEDGTTFYLVKFRKHALDINTDWLTRENLYNDIPDKIDKFDKLYGNEVLVLPFEKIIGEEIRGRVKYYLFKWKGIKKEWASWLRRSDLMKSNLYKQHVLEYENS